jgi:hypothetical protein
MAWYRPTASNVNWSTASNWETSSDATISTWGIANALPTVNDYVYLHNRNVILDTNATQSIKAALITNDALTPGINISPLAKISSSAGGLISCSLASRTGSNAIIITASFLTNTTNNLFNTISPALSNSITISGSLTGLSGGYTINHTVGGGTIYNIIGDITAGGFRVINSSVAATTFNVTGNLYSYTGGCIYTNGANSTINLTGSVYYLRPGGNDSKAAIQMAALTTLRITGSVYTGIGQTQPLVATSCAVLDESNALGSITITGNVYSGRNTPGVIVTSAAGSPVVIYGNLYNNIVNGTQAVACSKLTISASSQLSLYTTTNQTSSYASGSISYTYPSVNDVRSGSVYGVAPQYTGLMNTPSVNNVRYGTSVDANLLGTVYIPPTESVRLSVTSSQTNNVNSTGSVIIPLVSDVLLGAFVNTGSTTGSYGTVSDIWNFPSSSLTASGTVGEDIKLSLNTNVGSITGSTLTELNNPNSIYSIAKRLQNIATTSSIIYQFSSSTN